MKHISICYVPKTPRRHGSYDVARSIYRDYGRVFEVDGKEVRVNRRAGRAGYVLCVVLLLLLLRSSSHRRRHDFRRECTILH